MGFALSSRRKPRLVIPAKAGIQLSSRRPREGGDPAPRLFALSSALRETRLTSLCFFTRHPWRASHFLLLAQEKVTKEKGTPEGARPFGLFPPRTRRALGGPKVNSEAKQLCFVF